jgi:hypothetical protein
MADKEEKKMAEEQKRNKVKKYVMLLDFFLDVFYHHDVVGQELGNHRQKYGVIATLMGKRFKLFDDETKNPLIILTHGYVTPTNQKTAHERHCWLARHLLKKVSMEQKNYEMTFLDTKICKLIADFFELNDDQINALLIEGGNNENS